MHRFYSSDQCVREGSRVDLRCRVQDATAAAVAATSKGCAWNQRVEELVAAAGLRVTRRSRHTGGTLVMLEAVRPG